MLYEVITDQGARCVFLDEFKGKDDEPLPMIVQKKDGGYLDVRTTPPGAEVSLVTSIGTTPLNTQINPRITSYNVCYTKLLRIRRHQSSIRS